MLTVFVTSALFGLVLFLTTCDIATPAALPDKEETYYRSAYYNEYIVPHRAYDAAGFATRVAGDEVPTTLIVHHDSPTGPQFGERGIALLHLLYPAFRAGAETHRRLHAEYATLFRTIDGFGEAALLLSTSGHVLHQNPACQALLGPDPERPRLEQAARQLARGLGRLHRRRLSIEEAMKTPGAHAVGTTRARYDLFGSFLGGGGGMQEHYVLVIVAPEQPTLPSKEALREHFGLTRQQARVALLLAERKRNDEVADTLCISPHTARRHTEQVLFRLGVASRDEVRKVLVTTDAR